VLVERCISLEKKHIICRFMIVLLLTTLLNILEVGPAVLCLLLFFFVFLSFSLFLHISSIIGAVVAEPNSVNRGPEFVTITHSYFERNIANGEGPCLSSTSCEAMGGAVYLSVSKISIYTSHFIQNGVLSSASTKSSYGGAVFSTNLFGAKQSKSNTMIMMCNFTGNYAFGAGGAVYGVQQPLSIMGSAFDSNYVTSTNPSFTDTPTYAGAVWYSGSSGKSSITNCSFFHNIAHSGWGKICVCCDFYPD
jgi:hypothetical protein